MKAQDPKREALVQVEEHHPCRKLDDNGPARAGRSSARLQKPLHAGQQKAARAGATGVCPLPSVLARLEQKHS